MLLELEGCITQTSLITMTDDPLCVSHGAHKGGIEARDVLTSKTATMSLWPISYLGLHDLMYASCTCAAWYRDGGLALLELRNRAAVRIQTAVRRSLATMKTARLRCDKCRVMLHGQAPADADESLRIPQPLWAAYFACSVHDRFSGDWCELGDTYQEWAADKLCMYGLDAPADCLSLSGEACSSRSISRGV